MKKNNSNGLIEIVLSLLLMYPLALLNAWGFTVVWDNLLTPSGIILPLSIKHLIVFFVIKEYIFSSTLPTENNYNYFERLAFYILRPLLFIFSSWILSLFIY